MLEAIIAILTGFRVPEGECLMEIYLKGNKYIQYLSVTTGASIYVLGLAACNAVPVRL
jgi:hypothetical protein